MSRHRDEYRQWPFLNQEEFELACAFFDQRYVRASLGPTRQIFKIRSRRTLTTGNSYIEILRLLQLPEDEDELSLALAKLGNGGDGLNSGSGMEIDTTEEDADEVSELLYFIILRNGTYNLARPENINARYRKPFGVTRIQKQIPKASRNLLVTVSIHTNHM